MVLLCIAQLWLLSNLYMLHINVYQALNAEVLMFKTHAPSRLTNPGVFHLAHLNTENVFEIPLKIRREDKYNWSYTGNLNQELPQFAPGLNLTEYKIYRELIGVFNGRCKLFNITYFLIAGTAYGAYTHHGFIPWDDDFDVYVNGSQRQVLKFALESVEDHSMYTPDHYLWKFWNTKSSRGSRYKWKWPFIDIVFFEVNSTDAFDVTLKKKVRMFSEISDIFPLREGVFENMILPVPGNMDAYLSRKFSLKECISNIWSHKEEKRLNYSQKHVSCDTFFGVYPFVHRFTKNNFTYEELRLGNKTLYTIMSPHRR